MNRAGNPYNYVADPTKGRPLFNSDLYFGVPDLDPEVPANQIQVYLQQEDGTPVAVSQPVETGAGGVPMYNGSPAIILIGQDAYSFKALDRNGTQVYYQENAGATLGGGATVGSLENYAAVRALNGSSFTQVSVAGRDSPGDGGQATLYADESDTTTIDNGVDVFVDSGGTRWKKAEAMAALSADRLVQRKSNELFTGFDNGTTNTEIFSGAGNAMQGIAYAMVSGVEKIYATIKTTGTTYETTERMRIVEYNLTDDGSSLSHVAFTPELNIGHGQDISAEVVGSTVYIWAPSSTTVNGTGAGKGISRVTYSGASTSVVQDYLLCGASGSGHRREHLYQGTPCISSDYKYIVYVGDYAGSQGRREVLIFDKAEVVSAGDPLDVDPVYSFYLQVPQVDDGRIWQGVACDGRYVYMLTGYYNAFHWHIVQKYTLEGVLVREIPITTIREQFGLGDILDNSTLGNPKAIEPEGITLRNGNVLVGIIDDWRAGADVVSFEGENWAYIGTGATVSPNNMRFWVKTTKSAGGAYNSGSSYSDGTNYTRRTKSVWEIKAERGISGELPISPNNFSVKSSSLSEFAGGISYSFRYGDGYKCSAFSEARGAYYNAFAYNGQDFQVYDYRVGSDNSKSGSFSVDFSSGSEFSFLRAVGGSLSFGAGINLYGLNDGTAAGQLRLYSVDTSGATLRTITFRGNSPALYPGQDNLYSNGIGSLRWSVIYAGTGTINTSDARLKEQPRKLSDSEKRVAIKCKSLIKMFKFKDAVQSKGDDARWHSGWYAQEVIDAFASEGLDAFDYGMVCYDKWESEPQVLDDDGNVIQEAIEPGDRYGLRETELISFIISQL